MFLLARDVVFTSGRPLLNMIHKIRMPGLFIFSANFTLYSVSWCIGIHSNAFYSHKTFPCFYFLELKIIKVCKNHPNVPLFVSLLYYNILTPSTIMNEFEVKGFLLYEILYIIILKFRFELADFLS